MPRGEFTFPAVVGLIVKTTGLPLSEKVAQEIRNFLLDLRERESGGLIV